MQDTLNGRLEGKVAVVTGASTGIGRATMEVFSRAGAKVVGAARTQSTPRSVIALTASSTASILATATRCVRCGRRAWVIHRSTVFGSTPVRSATSAVRSCSPAARAASTEAPCGTTNPLALWP